MVSPLLQLADVMFDLRGIVDIDNMTAKMAACFRAEILRRFAGAT